MQILWAVGAVLLVYLGGIAYSLISGLIYKKRPLYSGYRILQFAISFAAYSVGLFGCQAIGLELLSAVAAGSILGVLGYLASRPILTLLKIKETVDE